MPAPSRLENTTETLLDLVGGLVRFYENQTPFGKMTLVVGLVLIVGVSGLIILPGIFRRLREFRAVRRRL